MISRVIENVLSSMVTRPKHIQVAALVYKMTTAGPRVLLITSRTRKRWIVPKGWPMDGKTLAEAARIEAWEEAGLHKTKSDPKFIGTFNSIKRLQGDLPLKTEVHLFLIHAKTMKKKFPESGQRKINWLRPKKAAKICDEPNLKPYLECFSTFISTSVKTNS